MTCATHTITGAGPTSPQRQTMLPPAATMPQTPSGYNEPLGGGMQPSTPSAGPTTFNGGRDQRAPRVLLTSMSCFSAARRSALSGLSVEARTPYSTAGSMAGNWGRGARTRV